MQTVYLAVILLLSSAGVVHAGGTLEGKRLQEAYESYKGGGGSLLDLVIKDNKQWAADKEELRKLTEDLNKPSPARNGLGHNFKNIRPFPMGHTLGANNPGYPGIETNNPFFQPSMKGMGNLPPFPPGDEVRKFFLVNDRVNHFLTEIGFVPRIGDSSVSGALIKAAKEKIRNVDEIERMALARFLENQKERLKTSEVMDRAVEDYLDVCGNLPPRKRNLNGKCLNAKQNAIKVIDKNNQVVYGGRINPAAMFALIERVQTDKGFEAIEGAMRINSDVEDIISPKTLIWHRNQGDQDAIIHTRNAGDDAKQPNTNEKKNETYSRSGGARYGTAPIND